MKRGRKERGGDSDQRGERQIQVGREMKREEQGTIAKVVTHRAL
jgi:hypothetical protein